MEEKVRVGNCQVTNLFPKEKSTEEDWRQLMEQVAQVMHIHSEERQPVKKE